MTRQFGETRRFWWHWQNLKKEDRTRHLLNGRAWLHHRPRGSIGMQWVLPSGQMHLDLSIGGGNYQVSISFAVGVFALYLYLEDWPWIQKQVNRLTPEYSERSLCLSFYKGLLSWHVWADPNEHRATTPRWRDGSIDVPDMLFGRNTYTRVEQPPLPATVSLPEGEYQATVAFFSQSWKRPRWPVATRRNGATIACEQGFPIPGKGEDAWNCEDTAYLFVGSSATTVEDAVSDCVRQITKRRERYGGKDWRPAKQ